MCEHRKDGVAPKGCAVSKLLHSAIEIDTKFIAIDTTLIVIDTKFIAIDTTLIVIDTKFIVIDETRIEVDLSLNEIDQKRIDCDPVLIGAAETVIAFDELAFDPNELVFDSPARCALPSAP